MTTSYHVRFIRFTVKMTWKSVTVQLLCLTVHTHTQAGFKCFNCTFHESVNDLSLSPFCSLFWVIKKTQVDFFLSQFKSILMFSSKMKAFIRRHKVVMKLWPLVTVSASNRERDLLFFWN